MGDVRVSWKVRQGYWATCPSGETIGTDGCAPCVGIIALLPDDKIFCGHLDNRKKIELDAGTLLKIFTKEIGDQVIQLGFVTNAQQEYLVNTAVWIPYLDRIIYNQRTITDHWKQVKPLEANGIWWNGKKICFLGQNERLWGVELAMERHTFHYELYA